MVLFYRFGVAALVILPWFIKAKKPKNMWQILVPFSLLGVGNALFFYQGITRTTASSASVIGASTPLLAAILSHYLIGERTSKEKLIGIGIGLVGALCIIILPLWGQGKSIGGEPNCVGKFPHIAPVPVNRELGERVMHPPAVNSHRPQGFAQPIP